MDSYVDLRYILPPLINIFFPGQDFFLDQFPILITIIIIIVTILLLLLLIILLFTSVKLPFNLHQIHLEPGSFSAPVAFLLLASLILPSSLFWFVYLILIITSPFHAIIFNLLNHSFRFLLHTLRSIPPLIIGFTFQYLPPAAPPTEVQLDDIVQHAMPPPPTYTYTSNKWSTVT